MTPEKIEVLSQKFVMSALECLCDEWSPLSALPYDYNTYETLCWLGVAERQLEQLFASSIPCGTRFYYRRTQP